MHQIDGFLALWELYQTYYLQGDAAMVETRPQAIRRLHRETQGGLMECKQALEASHWDFAAALATLKSRGLATTVQSRYQRRLEDYRKQTQPGIYLGGWIFVESDFCAEAQHIEKARFYLSKSQEEEAQMVDGGQYQPWLEFQTFVSIVDNKLAHTPQADSSQLIEAVVYYCEEDDFLD